MCSGRYWPALEEHVPGEQTVPSACANDCNYKTCSSHCIVDSWSVVENALSSATKHCQLIHQPDTSEYAMACRCTTGGTLTGLDAATLPSEVDQGYEDEVVCRLWLRQITLALKFCLLLS